MTDVPSAPPPDVTPAEAARLAEANAHLVALKVYLTGPNRFEIEERIRRLVVELIRQRDQAVSTVARGAAEGLRIEASRLDPSNLIELAAFKAFTRAAVELERAAEHFETRAGGASPPGVPPP